jgi:hypothetical protein
MREKATDFKKESQFTMPRNKITSNDIISLHKQLSQFKGKSLKELF